MKTFPIAKINLGLNIVERREDGYHNLETVFYPVNISDCLEVEPIEGSKGDCLLTIDGIEIAGSTEQNLVVRAYRLLSEDYPQMPSVKVHLQKRIPTQAGMGGGSSDGAFMLRTLNELFGLGLTTEALEAYAVRLGADCPFFINSAPCFAEGIGELLTPVTLDLKGWYLAIVRPDIPVPTREAFALIHPQRPQHCCRDIVQQPVETWRDYLKNDFEDSVFAQHPQLKSVKDELYNMGAVYAAMSGSGSSLFGLFRTPVELTSKFQDAGTFTACLAL